ncbi:MAG: hypothetical protein IT537_08565 [Hyphomicrobiales bacterium]|nr:hypothetical protein [Hyphomicrobiales bacterium]
MALIFDRMIQTIVGDCAERCELVDRGAFENVIAERMAPLISHFDDAAERLRAEESDDDDGSVGSASVRAYSDGGAS